MANRNERATSSIPKWLLPINRRKQANYLGPAVIATSTSTQASRSNHNHIQTQRCSSVPQYELEPSDTTHQISSTSPSLAFESDNAVASATKRKAPDVVPRDEEQRDCHPPHATTSLRDRGGVRANEIWISPDEGANIMMEATMASKNSRRRVTLSGGESHSKRARTVANANDLNDGESSHFLLLLEYSAHNCWTDTEILLSWSSKVGGVPPLVAQSEPPRYQNGIETDSAMDGITQVQIDMDSLEGWDLSLGARDENAPSGKALVSPGPPMVGAMRPLQECAQPVLGGRQGQSSRGKTSKERTCSPGVPEQGAHSSECRELDVGVALEPQYLPMPRELSTASLGDPPNIDNSHALDPVGTHGPAVLSETSD